ncbi:MAG: DUF5652 family protein [Patescibacteria group bacterium]|mgnify:CR=1 FL=1
MEQQIPFAVAAIIWIFIGLLAIWSLVWKGVALWHAAKRDEKWWYFFLLIINTAGILEIIYLAFVAKIWSKKVEPVIPPSPATPVAPTPASVAPVATSVPAEKESPKIAEQSTTTNK